MGKVRKETEISGENTGKLCVKIKTQILETRLIDDINFILLSIDCVNFVKKRTFRGKIQEYFVKIQNRTFRKLG